MLLHSLPTRECWHILTACGEGAVGGTFHTCCPTAHFYSSVSVDSECKRWNLEHVVLDLFSDIQTGKIQWLFVSCRGSGFCDLFQMFASFALGRLADLAHAVAARLRLSVLTWQHVYRRVLHELDIEFEPTRLWTKQFLQSLQLSLKLAATCTRHRPSEAGIASERNLLQLRVIFLYAIATKSHRIAYGTWTR